MLMTFVTDDQNDYDFLEICKMKKQQQLNPGPAEPGYALPLQTM